MGKIQINRLTNANVYLDGESFLGRAEEVQLPQIKHKMAEHKALGMVGTSEFFSGIDKLECKFKWAAIYSEIAKKVSNPFKAVSVQVRASLETYTGQGRTAEVPVVVYLTGTFKEFPLGNFKQHDNVELDTTMSVTYVKLVVDSEDIVEVDVIENIYKVEGEDILETYKNNIGG